LWESRRGGTGPIEPGQPALLLALIHPSAWNRNSPKFAKKVVINTAFE
jgi:uracil-DNA glycosylase